MFELLESVLDSVSVAESSRGFPKPVGGGRALWRAFYCFKFLLLKVCNFARIKSQLILVVVQGALQIG